MVDWNNDGRHDLLMGGLDGKVRVFLDSADSGEPDLRSELILQDGAGDLVVPTGRAGVTATDLTATAARTCCWETRKGSDLLRQYRYRCHAGVRSVAGHQAGGIEINLDGIAPLTTLCR